MARQRIIYKLPLAFQDQHKTLLDGWPWQLRPQMRLSETISEAPELADVVLDYTLSETRAGRAMVVRCHTARMAMILRRYAENLAAPATPESV